MSTTVITDPTVLPLPPPLATESPTIVSVNSTELQFAKCDCCGLTEECTPAYIDTIRERFLGNWFCGLCGEAVKDEIRRSKRLINTEEAMARHMNFCRKSTTSSDSQTNPTIHLISAMRQILRRSLESPRMLRSMPNSPSKSSGSIPLSRSESCITNLLLESSSYTDLQEMMK